MLKNDIYGSSFIFTFLFLVTACSQNQTNFTEIKHYPVNSMDGIITTKTGVEFDKSITSDGNGSLRITVDKPTTIYLTKLGTLTLKTLNYSIKLKFVPKM